MSLSKTSDFFRKKITSSLLLVFV